MCFRGKKNLQNFPELHGEGLRSTVKISPATDNGHTDAQGVSQPGPRKKLGACNQLPQEWDKFAKAASVWLMPAFSPEPGPPVEDNKAPVAVLQFSLGRRCLIACLSTEGWEDSRRYVCLSKEPSPSAM